MTQHTLVDHGVGFDTIHLQQYRSTGLDKFVSLGQMSRIDSFLDVRFAR